MRRAWVVVVALVVVGSLAAYAFMRRGARAATTTGEGTEVDAGHVAVPPCGPNDAVLFFHGRTQLGLEIVARGICAPRLSDDGEPGFWCDESARVVAPSARVLVGYSAGRIPVLRRLKAGASESVVALIDPSWSDGARFDGETGPDIVARWLGADPARTFVLVHAPDAAGYAEYLALREGPFAQRVLACAVSAPHDAIPRAVGNAFLRDPVRWIARTCPEGAYDPGFTSGDASSDASARPADRAEPSDAATSPDTVSSSDAATSSEP